MSGSTNAGEAFHLTAMRSAAESTYAGIVRLVDAAQRSRAPMSRMADRYAMVFLAATVALAAAAWFFSGDPIRAVAVLVVATPCPLILAVPVALVAGLSRAAKHGILIKGGRAIETLARVRALVIDKTGTLTHGEPRLVSIRVFADVPEAEVLRLAASLDQASQHVIAQTIVAEARSRGLALAVPGRVMETPGEGVEGEVDGRRVVVGGQRFVSRRVTPSPGRPVAVAPHTGRGRRRGRHRRQARGPPGARGCAAQRHRGLAGSLRALGVERIVLATGDRRDVAERVARGLSIDAVRSELTPDQKTLVVLSERKNGPVMMIGDGVNDAPALAAADLGVAMGAKGAAASAEAADVVLLVDRLDRILPALKIARRSRFIALESVVAGIGLSVAGMVAAAFGLISPVQGAVLQEVIDVAVILNSLRALYDRPADAATDKFRRPLSLLSRLSGCSLPQAWQVGWGQLHASCMPPPEPSPQAGEGTLRRISMQAAIAWRCMPRQRKCPLPRSGRGRRRPGTILFAISRPCGTVRPADCPSPAGPMRCWRSECGSCRAPWRRRPSRRRASRSS